MTAADIIESEKRAQERGAERGMNSSGRSTRRSPIFARHFDPLSSIARVKIDTICPLNVKRRERDYEARLKNVREIGDDVSRDFAVAAAEKIDSDTLCCALRRSKQIPR